MKIALADINEAGLQSVAEQVTRITGDPNNVLVVPTDVSKLQEVVSLRDKVYDHWGEVSSQRSAVVLAWLPALLFQLPHFSSLLPTPSHISNGMNSFP